MANPYIRPRITAFDYLGLTFGRRALERILEEELAGASSLDILDVGCGSAPWRGLFREVEGRYVGLDRNEGPAVDVVGSAESMPFEDGSFDVVFSISVLEHVPDAAAAVGEVERVLKPGGLAVIGVPFMWGLHGEPHDYRRWTPFGLRRLFAAFDSCRVVQTGGRLSNVLALQNAFLRKAQEAFYPARFLFTPPIVLNNLVGRLFEGTGELTSTFCTFYIAVARK